MRATTIRFSDPIYQRLEQASKYSGLPINAIVTSACMEWLRQQFPLPAGVDLFADPSVDPSDADAESVALERLLREQLRELVPLLAPDARAAILRAREEGRDFGHNYLGTEHLLLGIAAQEGSPGGKALQQRGINAAKLRGSIKLIVGRGVQPTMRHPGLTPRAAGAIERAAQAAQAREENEINTGHLLLGLCGDGEGLALRISESLGSSEEEIQAAVEALMG